MRIASPQERCQPETPTAVYAPSRENVQGTGSTSAVFAPTGTTQRSGKTHTGQCRTRKRIVDRLELVGRKSHEEEQAHGRADGGATLVEIRILEQEPEEQEPEEQEPEEV